MNTILHISALILIAGTMVLVASRSTPVAAQYVISARGGLVNYTTGPVTYRTGDDQIWKDVPDHTQLNAGDRLRTEDWGKAEILLNPGSYLRLGRGAEVVLMNTDIGYVSFELLSGSAVLEVADLPDEGTVAVQTPVTTVRIKKDGLYRIDVVADATTLTVRQGEAHFLGTDGRLKKVKKNRRAVIIGQENEVAKFDPDRVDDFDLWSADRAELLLAANQSFIRRFDSWSWPRVFSSAWIYDPFFGCYTFFPVGNGYWSPYGYGYYAPWYGGGYWTGGSGGGGVRPGHGYGGQIGSSGPGGTPPGRPSKPSYATKSHVSGDVSVWPGGRMRDSSPSRSSPSGGGLKIGGSMGGSVTGGSKTGGASGRPSGARSSGAVGGGAKTSGGNVKNH